MRLYYTSSIVLHCILALALLYNKHAEAPETVIQPIEIIVVESTKTLNKASGLSATDEVLSAVDERKREKQNPLMAKENIYYTYYGRVASIVGPHWIPCVENKGKRIYTTFIRVILNTIGDVEKVYIVKSSKSQRMDNCAVEAFKKGAIFPNPPKNLIDKDGKIRMNWILRVN